MSLQRCKQHGKEVLLRPALLNARVASLDSLKKGVRIYVLLVSGDIPEGHDAVLKRSGLYQGSQVSQRRPGQQGLDLRRQAILAVVHWDGNDHATPHAQDSLGITDELSGIYACVTSLEGINCRDGRDPKQKRAFTPQGFAPPT